MIDSSMSPGRAPGVRQSGAALIVSLLMLIAVSLLGMSVAQLALEGGKAARNERDRQLAFHAAEAALLDAELDIQESPDNERSRSSLFAPDCIQEFLKKKRCGTATEDQFLGLYMPVPKDGSPAWQSIVNASDATGMAKMVKTVPYGHFTGRFYPVGEGPLPGKVPHYLIELLPDRTPGQDATEEGWRILYRITAIGFGMRETTRVVLQTIYRKAM